MTFQSTTPQQGIGDLLIAPTRVVLDTSKRTAEINLLNIGDKPATYRISLIHERMSPNGKLEEIVTPAPGEQFADDLVRFTPRQVILEPHVAQLVRIQLRLPAELEAGEYRSHLLFRAVPAPGAPSESASTDQPKGIAIKITPIYGISIPLIVRSGDTSVTTGIDSLQMGTADDGAPAITGNLSRTGNASAYGEIMVEYAPNGTVFQTVGRVSGLALYTPNKSRTFAIRLSPPSGLKIQGGKLKVIYRQLATDGGRVLCDSTIDVP